MSRCGFRYLFTTLIYVGAAMFFYPYFKGEVSRFIPILLGGALLTITCGLLRCLFVEGDCAEHEMHQPHA